MNTINNITIKTQKRGFNFSNPVYVKKIEVSQEIFNKLKEEIDFNRPVKVSIKDNEILFETIIESW